MLAGLADPKLSAHPPALKHYIEKSLEELYTCRLRATLELLQRADAMRDTRACIVQAKVTLGPLYAAAREAVAAHASALPVLKDFYAAWLGGLDALFPSPGERDNAYQMRISEIQHKLTELGHRLTIEAQ